MDGSSKPGTRLYVGVAGASEIAVFSVDRSSGDLTAIERVTVPGIAKAGGSMPMAVSPDKRFLYAGLRGEPLVVATFAIDPASGRLGHLGNGALADSMPYITTDRSGRWLLSASYSGSKVAVNPIGADGVVKAPTQTLATPPNAHAILIDKANRHVLVPCLGGDVVNQFRFDAATGTLTPNAPAGTKTDAKAGPRHFRFSADERFVYLLNELDATLCVFHYDAVAGILAERVQVVSIMPPGSDLKPWGAELQLSPDGRFLYASERTSSTISAFRIDAGTGMLTRVGVVPTELQPRSFQIDPSGRYLYALGEKSDGMTSYVVDAQSGVPTKLRQYPIGKTPNWVEILDLP
jgi:6-phosphogluconolactonase